MDDKLITMNINMNMKVKMMMNPTLMVNESNDETITIKGASNKKDIVITNALIRKLYYILIYSTI